MFSVSTGSAFNSTFVSPEQIFKDVTKEWSKMQKTAGPMTVQQNMINSVKKSQKANIRGRGRTLANILSLDEQHKVPQLSKHEMALVRERRDQYARMKKANTTQASRNGAAG